MLPWPGGDVAWNAAIDARDESGQLSEVAAVERQIFDLPGFDGRPDIGAGAIHQCHVGTDHDLLGYPTRLQDEIDVRHLGNLQCDILLDRFEALFRDFENVIARRQNRERPRSAIRRRRSF